MADPFAAFDDSGYDVEADPFAQFDDAGNLPEEVNTFAQFDDSGEVVESKNQLIEGAKAGVDTTQALFAGLAGVVGDVVGSDRLRDWGLEEYKAQMEESQQYKANIPSYKDIGGIGDAVDYAMYGLGTTLPLMVPSLMSGGVGAIAAREVVKKSVTTYVAKETALQISKGVVKSKAAQIAAQKAVKRGVAVETAAAAAGSGIASVGLETGSIYGDIEEKTGQLAPWTALGFGTMAGAVDALPIMGVLKRLGVGKNAKDQIVKEVTDNMATAVGKQVIFEGGTEAFQTIIERAAVKWVDESKDVFTDEGWEDIVNATLTGSMAGGAMGAGAKVAEGVLAKKTPPTPMEEDVAGLDTDALLNEVDTSDLPLAAEPSQDEQRRAAAKAAGGDALDQELAAALGAAEDAAVATAQPGDALDTILESQPLEEEVINVQPSQETPQAQSPETTPVADIGQQESVEVPALERRKAELAAEDPLLKSEDWRGIELEATFEDGTKGSILAGDAYDGISRRRSYAQQMLDCVNASN